MTIDTSAALTSDTGHSNGTIQSGSRSLPALTRSSKCKGCASPTRPEMGTACSAQCAIKWRQTRRDVTMRCALSSQWVQGSPDSHKRVRSDCVRFLKLYREQVWRGIAAHAVCPLTKRRIVRALYRDGGTDIRRVLRRDGERRRVGRPCGAAGHVVGFAGQHCDSST